MLDFIAQQLKTDIGNTYEQVYSKSVLLQYLNSKMSAVYGDSKTRRSLANIYAIYSILYFYQKDFYNNKNVYKKFGGYPYQKLFDFYRSLYGGEKLQNHALNSRVNGEFYTKFNFSNPIIMDKGKYLLHIDILYVGTLDISIYAMNIIEKYIELLKAKDSELEKDLKDLQSMRNIEKKREKIIDMLAEESEARIFEILSYAILKNYYKDTSVYWGYSMDTLKQEKLALYKTGRTNANDGGIDFVMKPLGRFFQVTEVLESYDKYLLDMDKVMHFPVSFVIKTLKSSKEIREEIGVYIEKKSGGMEIIKKRYHDAIEEIITIQDLKNKVQLLGSDEIDVMIADIDTYYKLEMNLL